MVLVKTSVPGYKKDETQNLIIPDNLDQKIQQMKVNRERYKQQRGFESRLETLERKVAELIKICQR